MIKKNKNIKGWMKTHKLNNECFVNNIVSEMGIEIPRPSLIVYIYANVAFFSCSRLFYEENRSSTLIKFWQLWGNFRLFVLL